MKSTEYFSGGVSAAILESYGSDKGINLNSIVKEIQTDALNSAISIADTFALNHKLSAPEVIVAIQIREQIERLVKEIET